jgi:isochorismate hydrolase
MATQMHGLQPDRARAALLILDMISDFEFPQARPVERAARRIAPRIAELKRKARKAGVACVYVNDNPGRWRSDSHALIEHCLAPERRGADIVRQLLPDPDDYFVLKPRHSAFYATPLEVLLKHWGTEVLLLAGVSSHQCVLFTANDAHVRNLEVVIPSDCVAGPSARDTRFALHYFRSVLSAHVARSAKLNLRALTRKSGNR